MRCVAFISASNASGVAFANRPVAIDHGTGHAEGALRACDVASVLLGRATASQRRPRGSVRLWSVAECTEKAILGQKGERTTNLAFHR